MTIKEFFICDLRPEWDKYRYVSFWRPKSEGYCFPIPWAGLYALEEIKANRAHYIKWTGKSLTRFPVSAEDIAGFLKAPQPGTIDYDTGPVVPNSPEVRKALRAAAQASIFKADIHCERVAHLKKALKP